MVHDEFHPSEVLQTVWDLVQPSASIVVFSQYLNPLVELRDYLSLNKMAVFTKIEELWTREHQVLPMRTHPHMSMHGASGYLFSCIKVV